MLVHTFLVDSAAEAVGLIRGKLGPDAVVLSVRKVQAEGVSKLWRKPRLEVLATVPPSTGGAPAVAAAPAPDAVASAAALAGALAGAVDPSPAPAPVDPLLELRREMSEIRAEVLRAREAGPTQAAVLPVPAPPEDIAPLEPFTPKSVAYPGQWQVGPILEATGVLPRHALRLLERLCVEHGEVGPEAVSEQLELAARVLKGEWLVPDQRPARGGSEIHVLVGPPGSGKTTALCKWLAQLVLVEGRSVAVFRLDGVTANTGEFLSVHAEVLGVPVQRSLVPDWRSSADLVLVDLPGVSHLDRPSMQALRGQVQSLRPDQIHLVLNAAYDASLMMAQARAYVWMEPTDWWATHLDEEGRWGKLWNGIMGTNCPLSWLSVGQNIPGLFQKADPDRLVRQQLRVQTTAPHS